MKMGSLNEGCRWRYHLMFKLPRASSCSESRQILDIQMTDVHPYL